jgi:hypothetical protein
VIGVRMVAAGAVWAATTVLVAMFAAGAMAVWLLQDRLEGADGAR